MGSNTFSATSGFAWQDAQLNGIWRTRLAQRAGYALRVGAPGLRGIARGVLRTSAAR